MADADRVADFGVPEVRAWSPSRIKAAGQCGAYYRFKYVDYEKEPPSVPLQFGDAFHGTAEAMHKQGLWSIAQYQAVWRERWAENAATIDWERQPRNVAKKATLDTLGPKMLNLFAKQFKDEVCLATEYRFPLLDAKAEERYFIGKHEVTGIIDRFQIGPDKRIWVVDYKTGSRVPSKRLLGADVQFSIYWHVAKQKYGEEPRLFWYQARDGKMIETFRVAEDMKVVEAMIDEFAQTREIERRFARNIGYSCESCPFVRKCLNSFAIPRGEAYDDE